MNRKQMLNKLKAISRPILVDGGSWTFGCDYQILTAEGVISVSCTAYDPIQGPINVSKKRSEELKSAMTRQDGENQSEEEDQAEFLNELSDEEQLFLIHNGEPETDYWAFQPYDGAPLSEYTFSADRKIIELAMIDQSMEGEFENWDDMKSETLSDWMIYLE